MVAVMAVIIEQFLHRDPDRRAAAPDADEVRRLETAIDDLHSEAKGVGEQVVRADDVFRVGHGAGVVDAAEGGKSVRHWGVGNRGCRSSGRAALVRGAERAARGGGGRTWGEWQ